MYGTLAMLPIPTIAVVKGAAIAGGCMLSFAHDLIYVIEKGLFACN
jgi:enoyl-CoA hydratase/carnithine racemase